MEAKQLPMYAVSPGMRLLLSGFDRKGHFFRSPGEEMVGGEIPWQVLKREYEPLEGNADPLLKDEYHFKGECGCMQEYLKMSH